MTHKLPALSALVRQALTVSGQELTLARKEQGWTQAELAERAGITRKTLSAIEAGSPAVSIGTVFEVARLLGVDLLGVPDRELPAVTAALTGRLALAPRRVRHEQPASLDSF